MLCNENQLKSGAINLREKKLITSSIMKESNTNNLPLGNWSVIWTFQTHGYLVTTGDNPLSKSVLVAK